MTKLKRSKRAQRGFTLVELMVTVALFAIFVPAVLSMQSMIARLSWSGVNRNVAMMDVRSLQLNFIRKINASGRNIRIRDGGNKVVLELYNESEGKWGDGALYYLPDSKRMVYISPETVTPRIIADNVHPRGGNPIFSLEDGEVKCDLFIGKNPPEVVADPSRFVTPGIFVNIVAAPRNTGEQRK